MYDKDLADVLKALDNIKLPNVDKDSVDSVANILTSSILGPRSWIGGNYFDYMYPSFQSQSSGEVQINHEDETPFIS